MMTMSFKYISLWLLTINKIFVIDNALKKTNEAFASYVNSNNDV